MKVRLMHPEVDFDPELRLADHTEEVTADLGLETLWRAMAANDAYLYEIARAATFHSLEDPAIVAFRHDVLDDLRADPDAARTMYELATEAMRNERRIWSVLRRTPTSTLHRSVEAMGLLVGSLDALHALVDGHARSWRSEGLVRLAGVVSDELDPSFFAEARRHLDRLAFKDGVWMSAHLGQGNKGVDVVLREPPDEPRWRELLHLAPSDSLSFEVHPRDEAGLEALATLQDRGLNLVANALAQSVDHVVAFFAQLKAEAGFYMACLNLESAMARVSMPLCRPDLGPPSTCPTLSARSLYDGTLALRTGGPVTGNDLDADGRRLIMVTGANSGGKSTFLRSVGLAHLMAQAGIPVFAEHLDLSAARGLFTHFARNEDAAIEHGRFDDELQRMRSITEHLVAGSLVLCNESFAGTSEWEASQIARQVVRAFVDSGVRVVFVTHLYDLARTLYEDAEGPVLFVRAERLVGGDRTFRMLEGAPLPTSFGPDLYERIGGFEPATAGTARG